MVRLIFKNSGLDKYDHNQFLGFFTSFSTPYTLAIFVFQSII